MKAIPIIILSKDEPDFLESTVRAIIKHTKYPYNILVVDNASRLKEQKDLLKKISLKDNVTVIYNTKNRWILGVNSALDLIRKNIESFDDRYVVITDGDIVVPESSEDACWLEKMVKTMDDYACIGKLGASLDLSGIKQDKHLSHIYKTEYNYLLGPKINQYVIAPVDTTLAIYRRDLFIYKNFKLFPGHASLVAPYYYTCRDPNLIVQHLGWSKYSQIGVNGLKDKVFCFTKYAAYVDKTQLARLPWTMRLYRKVFLPVFKFYWGARVLAFWTFYIARNFPRDLNQLQAKKR